MDWAVNHEIRIQLLPLRTHLLALGSNSLSFSVLHPPTHLHNRGGRQSTMKMPALLTGSSITTGRAHSIHCCVRGPTKGGSRVSPPNLFLIPHCSYNSGLCRGRLGGDTTEIPAALNCFRLSFSDARLLPVRCCEPFWEPVVVEKRYDDNNNNLSYKVIVRVITRQCKWGALNPCKHYIFTKYNLLNNFPSSY